MRARPTISRTTAVLIVLFGAALSLLAVFVLGSYQHLAWRPVAAIGALLILAGAGMEEALRED